MNKDSIDKKIDEILASLREMKIEEVAEMYGYKNVRVLKSIMYRYKYNWNSTENTFVKKKNENKAEAYMPSASTLNGKIILTLKKNNGNLQEALKVTRFKTIPELAKYMSEQNYKWDGSLKNYVQSATIKYLKVDEMKKTDAEIQIAKQVRQENQENSDINKIDREKCLDFVINNFEQIKLLVLEVSDPNIMPRYCVPGINITKSLYMVNTVSDLISRYSCEKHISQKDLAEIAFIEFFKKYGYQNEIKEMFV